MTENERLATPILGSLRSADGAGVCASRTATTLISTTFGKHSPIRAVWAAGTDR